jgi:uncharacterized protein (TIGR02147 family)
MNAIYSYTDYRHYLRDTFASLKTTQRRFSHRAMASRLGFTAPNFLLLVMNGKRNLGRESIGKITKGLHLNKSESEYFSHLVFFIQAKDAVEKNYYFGLITGMRARLNTTLLQADQFEYFSRWYHPAVREAAAGRRHPLDYTLLSKTFNNAVSPTKLGQSVTLLLRLGLLTCDENGIYRQTAATLNTENELNSFAVRQYHEQVLNIARKVLYAVPPAEREIASATLHLSESGFGRIKQRLQDFRQELLQIAHDDSDPERVYHVNLQFYPLTGSERNENAE